MTQVARRAPAFQAVVNEQSRDQEHEGHEETVVEQYDQVEAEPAYAVAVAEIGVVDGGVGDPHQEGGEGARGFDCAPAPRRHGGLIAVAGFFQHFSRLDRTAFRSSAPPTESCATARSAPSSVT